MDWNSLLEKQRLLDETILGNIGLEEYTINKIKTAFMVEVCELANEVQDFKYWKLSKVIDTARVLDEWADCFHFALSIYNYRGYNIHFTKVRIPRLKIHLPSWTDIAVPRNKQAEMFLCERLIAKGLELGFTEQELFNAYLVKNEINYNRIASKY